MNPRAVLQERYPSVNLILYFAFIDLCRQCEPEPQKGLTHEHHICPKKQFPEHIAAPENLITLYKSLHMHAHKLLGKAVPELSKANAAWIACASENGRKTKESGAGIFAPGMQAKGGRIGGRTQGRKNKENGVGWFAPGMAAKGGRKNKENGVGWFAPGMAAKGGRIGGRIGSLITNHIRWHVNRGIINPKCSLCQKADAQ